MRPDFCEGCNGDCSKCLTLAAHLESEADALVPRWLVCSKRLDDLQRRFAYRWIDEPELNRGIEEERAIREKLDDLRQRALEIQENTALQNAKWIPDDDTVYETARDDALTDDEKPDLMEDVE